MSPFLAPLLALMLASSSPSSAPVSPTQSAPSTTTPPTPFFLFHNLIPKVECPGKSGTGFVVDQDTIYTAQHVIDGEQGCRVYGEPAAVIFEDKDKDFAVLKAPTPPYRFIVNCEGFKEGESYYATGWPKFGYITQRYIGTSTKLNGLLTRPPWRGQALLIGSSYHGQSGGPVVDTKGHVVGIMNGNNTLGLHYAYSRELKDTYACNSQ